MQDRERRVTVLAIAALALVAGLVRVLPVSDSDTPWHVFHGQRVLVEHAARYAETSSFTRFGDTFVNHEWLADVVLALSYRWFGWGGLSALCGLCGALSTALIGALVVRAGGFRPLSVFVTAMVASACAFQLEPRPQSFVLVLFPVGLMLADEFADIDRPAKRSLIGLVVLQVVWAQTHSSFSLLPALVALALAGTAFRRGLRPVLRRALLPVLLAMLFVTAPHRLGYFAMVFRHARGDGTAHITEWQPLRLTDLYPTRFNSILWLDALLAIAVARSVRARRVLPEDAARSALGLALSLTAHRFRPLWTIFVGPWAVRRYDSEEQEARPTRTFVLAAVLGSIVVVALNTLNAFERGAARGWGARLDRDAFPVDATSALRKVGARGRLLNHYGDGGYLSLALAGQLQIAIDGRTPLFFDDELFFLMRRAYVDPAALSTVLARWQPDSVLLPRQGPVCRALAADTGWHAAYVDDKRTLFVRDPRGFPTLKRLDPCAPEASTRTCVGAGELHAELAALSALVEDAPYPLLLGAQLAMACGGDPAGARALTQRALASGTRNPSSWLTAANVFARAGAPELAAGAVDLAIEFGAGLPARRVRAQLALARNDGKSAVDDLAFLVKTLGDDAPADLRREYARALAAVGDHEEAAVQSKRADWTTASSMPSAAPAPAAPTE